MALKTKKTTAKTATKTTTKTTGTKRKAAEVEDEDDDEVEEEAEETDDDDEDILEEAPAKKKKQKAAAADDDEEEAPVTGKGSWFTEGEESFEKKEQNDQLAELRRSRMVDRFYLKDKTKEATDPNTGAKQTEARIVFLDSKPFAIYEHSLKINGKYGNMFTCTRDFGPCPICDSLGERPTFTMYLTIIDTRKFTKKKPDPKTGATISEPRRKLIPLKGVAQDKIKEILAENDNNLRGLVVDVKRYDAKEPNCGRDFTVKGRLSEAKLQEKFKPEMLQKYVYKEVLAPPKPKELKAAGVHISVVAGSAEDLAQDADGGDEDMKSLLD